MNIFAKIAIYLILIITAVYFGKHFLRDYQTVSSKKTKIQMLNDPVANIDTSAENAESQKPNAETQNPPEPIATAEPDSDNVASKPSPTSPPSPRLGFYGGGL